MAFLNRVALMSVALYASLACATCHAEDGDSKISVHEIRAILDSIPPYLPDKEVAVEIDVFGSTSMDSLAHGWADGFKRFHPSAKVVISAEGSETVLDRLAKNPLGIGMLSRPVSDAELTKLKDLGLKHPVAVMVAREGLGVFVHESNPLESISQNEFVRLFCAAGPNGESESTAWGEFGVTGNAGDKPVVLLARSKNSGTQRFIEDYLFAGRQVRAPKASYSSNAEVVKALEEDQQAVAIFGLKCGGHSLRLLGLESNGALIPCDDHAVLLGRYPLIRPLTLVLDAGQENDQAVAAREFAEYALHQAGQSQAILSGFFPFDPPTLRGEIAKLDPTPAESDK